MMKSSQVLQIIKSALESIELNGQPVKVSLSYADAPTTAHAINHPLLIPEILSETISKPKGTLPSKGFTLICKRVVYVQGFIKTPANTTPSDLLDELNEGVRLALLTTPKHVFQDVEETECSYILPESGGNISRLSCAYLITYINKLGG